MTRHNFEACFADLKKDIELPTCRFIAIDTEFTGLSPHEDKKERFLGTVLHLRVASLRTNQTGHVH